MGAGATNDGRLGSSVRDLWAVVRVYFSENVRGRIVVAGMALLVAVDLAILFAVPLVTEGLVNALTGAGSSAFWNRLLVLAGLVVVKTPVAYLLNVGVLQVDESVALTLRRRTIQGALDGSLEHVESFTVGDLASRLVNDVSTVKSVVTSMLLQPIVDVVSLCALVVILLRLHPVLALLLCLSVPGSLVLRATTQEAIRSRTQRVRESLGELSHRITAWLSSAADLKANHLEHAAVQSVDASGRVYRTFAVGSGRFGAGVSAANAAIVGIPTLLVFGYGGQLVLKGSLSIGALVAFFAYVGYFTAPIQRLMTVWVSGVPAMAPSARRLLSLWKTADTALPGLSRADAPKEVQVRDFEFVRTVQPTRSGWRLSVGRIDLRRGEIVVLCGPNGSGKTTLLRALAGAYRASGIAADGNAVFVSEHPPMFPGSLIENVTLFAECVDWTRLNEISSQIGLTEIVALLPMGWNTLMDGASVGRLSAGQTKRVALARAMYSQSQIWLLDEPFGALDEAHSRLFGDALARARPTHIIVIATHDNLHYLPADSRICRLEADPARGGFVLRDSDQCLAAVPAV